MTEAFPPLYNFNGINFNSDYFAIPNTASGGGGISIAYANSHYLASYAGAVATSLASSTSFSNKIINTNTLYALPSTGTNGGNGDRLIIYQGGTGVYPYSIGASSGSMWYSVPSLTNHNFLINGTSMFNIGSVGVGINSPPSANYRLIMNGNALIGNSASYTAPFSTGVSTVIYNAGDAGGVGVSGQQLVIGDTNNTNNALLIGTNYNAGTPFASIQSVQQTVGYKSLNLNPAGGGVGIGTTNPNSGSILDVRGNTFINVPSGYNYSVNGYQQKLTISGTGSGGWCHLYIYDSGSASTNYTGLQITANDALGICYLNSGKQGTGTLPLMFNTTGGGVGIGTTTFTNAGLAVCNTASASGDRSTIKCGPYGSDYMVIGCADTVGNAGGNANTAVIINSGASLRIESATGKNILMNFLNTGGFVGIGGITPSTRLHVASGSFGYGLQTQTWFQASSSGLTTTFRDVANLCATFESSISVNGIITATSDERIKKNIELIDNGIDIIKQLEPKKYNYIDGLTYGANVNYGFIAQDVEKILPDLIIKNKNVIPNIYKKASCFDSQITTDFNISSILNIGDDVEIITGEKRKFYKIIDIVDEFNFIINEELEEEEVFIYGSKIDDILSISKDDIFSINVKATKELITKVEELSKIVETQQEQINKLLSLIK